MNDTQRQFIRALESNSKAFGISLSAEKVFNLAKYYELVCKHNDVLHLVAPSPPETFAVRHVLESLFAEKFLPKNASFADIGTGAGLPSVPLLIAREDTRGFLVESKLKKGEFLQEVLAECKLSNRAEILNRQFEELPKPDISYVLCRALDKFTQKLPKLLKWSDNCSLLFFGGNTLRDELQKCRVKFDEKLLPLSERRFLFVFSKNYYRKE
ncbi:MAG TPA: RsmG family class I SAM-dependent methyltransferase [Pyrinomonadaceae bacterium]|nr:RsmG family class I SAM-dependent methyltransferase [Pyrinomonadaceae bacterium]